MSTQAPASPTGARPYNGLLLTSFVALSTVGASFMHVASILYEAQVEFNNSLAAGTHANGVRIIKSYTGIGQVDQVLATLVTAFMPGTAGWDETFYWQQFHFISQIAGLIAVMNVEACRERNSGSWLKYTAIYALLYQNIGGAIIIPIWMLLLHKLSGKNQYFSTGRAVPVQYARLILPSTLVIFLGPTFAMFYPGWSMETLQLILAFWQFTPVLVNVPLWLASPFASPSTSSKAKKADLPHLKILYNTLFVVLTAVHVTTIAQVVTSETPGVSLQHVFLPNPALWKTSMSEGLLWVFQWDWVVCALLNIIPAIIAIYDVVRFIPETDTDPLHDRLFKGVYIVAALTVFGGPAAALVAVWGWREEQLVIIEERAAGGKKKL